VVDLGADRGKVERVQHGRGRPLVGILDRRSARSPSSFAVHVSTLGRVEFFCQDSPF
jgi:hypothetical protein